MSYSRGEWLGGHYAHTEGPTLHWRVEVLSLSVIGSSRCFSLASPVILDKRLIVLVYILSPNASCDRFTILSSLSIPATCVFDTL